MGTVDRPTEILEARTPWSKLLHIGPNRRRLQLHKAPIHIPADFDKWMRGEPCAFHEPDHSFDETQEDRVLRRGFYGLRVHKRGVGFTYESKTGGGRIRYHLEALGGLPVDEARVAAPTREGRQLVWRDIVPELDLILEIRAHNVELYKRIKGPNAPRSFLWRVTEGKDCRLVARHQTAGHDNADLAEPSREGMGPGNLRRRIHMAPYAKSAEFYTDGGKKTYTVLEQWTGKTVKKDPITKVRSLDDEVVYPVLIDVTVNETVAANGDDGDEIGTAGTWEDSYGSTGDHIIYDESSATVYHAPGWRFTTVAIPQGATINTATLTLNFKVGSSGAGAAATVYGWKTADAPAWTNGAGPIEMTRTTASVALGQWGGSLPNPTSRVLDVAAILQEITDQATWASGNSVAFGVSNFTQNNNSAFQYIDDLAGGTSNVAALDVDYSSGSLDLEGFRFRNDDGSESSATWFAAQDTNVTQALSTNIRLRTIVNATLDPASFLYRLEYKKSSESIYWPVKTSTTPTVSYGTDGGVAYSAASGTTVTPSYPTGITPLSALVMVVGQKPSTANSGTVTTPTGWTLLGSLTGAGGYGATLGADTGNTNIFVYTKDTVDGSESGTLSVTVGTNNVCWAIILRVDSDIEPTWSYAMATGSQTAGGNVNITASSNPGVQAGDMCIAAMVIPTDVTTPAQFSSEAFSQTGITFGTITEIVEPDTTNGNDLGGVLCYGSASSGTASAAPTVTATAGGTTTNVRGPLAFIRLRAASHQRIVLSASANIASSGENTTAQLTPPSGKTTSNFTTGRIQDDTNPTSGIDIASGNYTELEWCLQAISPAAASDAYVFRVTTNGAAFASYSVTPQLTIGSSGTTLTVGNTVHTHAASAVSLTQANTLAMQSSVHLHVVGNIDLVQQNTLAVQGSAHVLTSSNIDLVQQNTLAVNSTAHVLAVESVALTQQNTLVVQGSVHLVVSTVPALTQANILAMQSAAHLHVVESPTLDVNAFLTVASSYHVVASSNADLVQQNLLAVDSCAHIVTTTTVALTQANTLAMQDSAHLVVSGNIDLVQQNLLAVSGTVHTTAAESAALTQANTLATQDSAHITAAESVALTQANTLAMQGAVHLHTVEAPELSGSGQLSVASTVHTTAAENVALTQANILALQGAVHLHTAESVVLDAASINLVVASTVHTTAAEAVSLTEASTLAVQGAVHVQAAETPALVQAHILNVDGASHTHTVETFSLTQDTLLAVANAVHTQVAEGVVLTQSHVLAVASAAHLVASDVLALTESSTLVVNDAVHQLFSSLISLTGLGNKDTPVERVFILSAENRTFIVAAQTRVFDMDGSEQDFNL